MYHLKYYLGREMHVKLHALKYKFLHLGLSLEVRENAKKKNNKKLYLYQSICQGSTFLQKEKFR